MIDQAEYQACMRLMQIAGQEEGEKIVACINAISEVSPGSLTLWLDLAETIHLRADMLGFERGKAEQEAAQARDMGGVKAITPPQISGFTLEENAILRTFKGARGVALPECVARYIKMNYEAGKGVSWAMTRFGISHQTARKVMDEVEAPKIAALEAANGVPPNGSATTMPPDFLEN